MKECLNLYKTLYDSLYSAYIYVLYKIKYGIKCIVLYSEYQIMLFPTILKCICAYQNKNVKSKTKRTKIQSFRKYTETELQYLCLKVRSSLELANDPANNAINLRKLILSYHKGPELLPPGGA